MRFIALFLVACASIPGTDVPIPAERHEGYSLSICLPSSTERQDACCGYSKGSEVRVICTEDGGEHWEMQDVSPEVVEPPEEDTL